MGIISSSESSADSETDESFVGNKGDVHYQGNKMTKRKKEETDENIKYLKEKSNATCEVDEIEGFIYGASTSRFWMMRKHVNSIDINPNID